MPALLPCEAAKQAPRWRRQTVSKEFIVLLEKKEFQPKISTPFDSPQLRPHKQTALLFWLKLSASISSSIRLCPPFSAQTISLRGKQNVSHKMTFFPHSFKPGLLPWLFAFLRLSRQFCFSPGSKSCLCLWKENVAVLASLVLAT